MTNHDIIKNAFDGIVPSDELVNKILLPEKSRRKRRISMKKTAAVIIAACAVLVCGVSAAAAGGYIDFEAVFGNQVRVDDSELADSLMGTVSNMKYKVSDDDYKISIKGVTGSKYRVIAIAEISRVDGTPVTEHFLTPLDDQENQYIRDLWSEFGVNRLLGGSCGGSYGAYINDEGNIEIHIDLDSDRSLNGRQIYIKGQNFYPAQAYWNFKEENSLQYIRTKDYTGYALVTDDPSDVIPAEADDSGVIALELEWECSFRYNASAASMEKKSCTSPEEKFSYYQNICELVIDETGTGYMDESSLIVYENICTVKSIDISPLEGHLIFEYSTNDYEKAELEQAMTYSIKDSDKNEMYLILSDGSHLPVRFGGGSGSTSNDTVQYNYSLIYAEDYYTQMIADIEDVTAIYINGVTYTLE